MSNGSSPETVACLTPWIFRLALVEIGRGRWEWPALAEGISSVFRLLPVMQDAGLLTSTTLFLGTGQGISSAGWLEQGSERVYLPWPRSSHSIPTILVVYQIEQTDVFLLLKLMFPAGFSLSITKCLAQKWSNLEVREPESFPPSRLLFRRRPRWRGLVLSGSNKTSIRKVNLPRRKG
jgi:hypothetical protein